MIVLLVYGTINTLFMIYNNYEYKMALLTNSGNIYLITNNLTELKKYETRISQISQLQDV